MLVQALAQYADTYLQEQLGDPAFEMAEVKFELIIDLDGHFMGVHRHEVERIIPAEGKKKEKKEPKERKIIRGTMLLIPQSLVRATRNVIPLLYVNQVPRLLGPRLGNWSAASEVRKHTEHFEAHRKLVDCAADETQNPWCVAVQRFYQQAGEVEAAASALASQGANTERVVFAIASAQNATRSYQYIYESEVVKNWWRKQAAEVAGESNSRGNRKSKASVSHESATKTETAICLVSGIEGEVARIHLPISGLSRIGGKAGCSLISFNEKAFESYGWSQSGNAPLSPVRALAYVNAFNDLIKSGRHRRGKSADISVSTSYAFKGSKVMYLAWTREPSDDDCLNILDSPTPESVNLLLNSARSGKQEYSVKPNDFYLLAISTNDARIIVRSWNRDNLANIQIRLAAWFHDQRLPDVFHPGDMSEPKGVYALTASLLPNGSEVGKGGSDRLTSEMFRRAFFGAPVGRRLLAAALQRVRTPPGAREGDKRPSYEIHVLNTIRNGLIRMAVNDLERIENRGNPIMPETLDQNLSHPAYICGRLLAVYSSLQFASQGEVNVSIVDRYYGMAMTNPANTFPSIDKLSVAHLKKARRDKPAAARAIERRLAELMETLHGQFPGQLNLEDQGRFVIGFHHQKAEDQKRIQESKQAKNAPSDSGHDEE